MSQSPPTRILIVEDEAIVARDISQQITRAGYERAGVTTRGEEAVELAGRLRPDLVLMDIQLAGAMDGIEAATRIREQHQIPVVFITSFADQAVLQRASAAEPFGYVVKPFEERELQPAIEIALHKHRAERALRRSEERFRRLFNGVRDAVLIADIASGRLIEANDEACRLFGRERASLVGLEFSALHPPEEAETYRGHFTRHAEGSSNVVQHACILTADGRRVPVEINAGLVDLGDRSALLGVFRDVSARQAAESAARERQARLDAVFRTAPAGIGLFRDSVLLEVNDHVLLMTGYTREALVGQSPRMLHKSDADFEETRLAASAQLRTHRTASLETTWRRRDGSLLDVLLSVSPINPEDPVPEFAFTAIDITERKRIKTELTQRNRTLEAVQRISQLVLDAPRDSEAYMGIAAEVGAVLQTRFAALLQHPPQARLLHVAGAFGVPPGTRIPREIPLLDTLAARVLQQASPECVSGAEAALHAISPALVPFPPHLVAAAPLVVAGRPVGVLVVAHDSPHPWQALMLDQLEVIASQMTGLIERREARAAQVRSETELLAIYDHAPVIICLLDEDMHIIRVNQTAARFAGQQPSDLRGARGGDLLSCLSALDDSRGCGFGPQCTECPLRTTVLDTLRTGVSHAQVEVSKGVLKEGSTQQLHMLVSTARVDLDGRRRILLVMEDITENRRLTEQLMRAQRMESIGTLASGIAHDLNNVLAPIVMCLGMLRDTAADDWMREMIGTMQVAANRGADIVRQVLTFARGLGGERVEIQSRHVMQEVARIARETFPRSIEIVCDYGGDLPTILGDPTQIQQVLMNLCVNARDAMPGGGTLSLRATRAESPPADSLPVREPPRDGFVCISVSDTGVGMPPEVRERIFEPFFTTKPVGKGTGLGLAVSLGIIERHGGAVAVQSTPGEGSTFRVYLPVADPAAIGRAPAEPEEQIPSGRGELILVVDDEPGVRSVMGGMLEKAGYRCLAARDGSEALTLLGQKGDAVRLVVTDVMMPGMDGLALIPRIRASRPGLPIIAMTGLEEDDVREEATRSGARRVLAKPFSSSVLLWAVHDFVAG